MRVNYIFTWKGILPNGIYKFRWAVYNIYEEAKLVVLDTAHGTVYSTKYRNNYIIKHT
jgi:hypothetical protein